MTATVPTYLDTADCCLSIRRASLHDDPSNVYHLDPKLFEAATAAAYTWYAMQRLLLHQHIAPRDQETP